MIAMLQNIANRFRATGYDAAISDRRRRDLPYARAKTRAEDQYIGTADREKLRARCFDLRRNNAIVAGIVERMAENIVGGGITPQAKTQDKAWNAAAESYWREWSKICDVRGRVDMRELQRLAVQMRLLAGELLVVLTDDGRLQPVEPDRVQTPAKLQDKANVIDGFRIDPKTGATLGVYVLPRDGNGNVDQNADWQYIGRENVLHMTRPMRFDQVRGIPDLAPVINTLIDFKELNEATLGTAKRQAMASFAITKEGGTGSLGPRSGGQDIGTPLHEKFEDGQNYYLRPGESIDPLGTAQPNATFMPYTALLLRQIGAAIGLPYEFLLLDFSVGTYSSSRAALIQTYRTFSAWQAWLDRGMQRIWNWRIAKAIKAGELQPAPVVDGVSQWFRVEWSHPEWEWVDPDSQAISETREIMAGKKSWSQIVRKTGGDLEDVIAQKEGDIAAAIEAAGRVNARFPGAEVHWTRFIDASVMGGQPPELAAQARKRELELREKEAANA